MTDRETSSAISSPTPRTDAWVMEQFGYERTFSAADCLNFARQLERENADLLAFAESVVTLFTTGYAQAGLNLDMDKASLLNAAREVITKTSGT